MDYFNNQSGLNKIAEYYKNLKVPGPWSLTSASSSSKAYAARPGLKPEHDSSRFGPGAYAKPVEMYYGVLEPRVTGQVTVSQMDPNLKIDKNDNGAYMATYTRTNRNMGALPVNITTYSGDWGTWTSPATMSPKDIDQLLDYVGELDRTDPNVYEHDASNLPKPKQYVSTGSDDKNPLVVLPTPPLSDARTPIKFY